MCNILDPLLVGNLMWSDVFHLALSDDTQVNVATGTKVIEDACRNAISNQLHSLLSLQQTGTSYQHTNRCNSMNSIEISF